MHHGATLWGVSKHLRPLASHKVPLNALTITQVKNCCARGWNVAQDMQTNRIIFIHSYTLHSPKKLQECSLSICSGCSNIIVQHILRLDRLTDVAVFSFPKELISSVKQKLFVECSLMEVECSSQGAMLIFIAPPPCAGGFAAGEINENCFSYLI